MLQQVSGEAETIIVGAAEHARDFFDAFFTLDEADFDVSLVVCDFLGDGKMTAALFGDLMKVSDQQNLLFVAEGAQAGGYRFGGFAPDAGIDFVENQRW